MLKTGRFTTKCKGDRVIAIPVEHALTSEVMSKIITRCEFDGINGHFSNTSRTPIHQLTSHACCAERISMKLGIYNYSMS